jgi:hypothetical protein
MKKHYLGILGAGWLFAALPAGAAEDVFTPLTAVPFQSATTPVPGTDGKWHFVYELELANTRGVPATLGQVQAVAMPPAKDEPPGRARGRSPPGKHRRMSWPRSARPRSVRG